MKIDLMIGQKAIASEYPMYNFSEQRGIDGGSSTLLRSGNNFVIVVTRAPVRLKPIRQGGH